MFTWILLPAVLLSATPQDPYTPLRLYDGSWTITVHDQASGKTTTDALVNSCSLVGRYFTCQQTVNGKISALVVFIPAADPGHYYTQNVLPEGWATGRGELTISGDHWVYSSRDEEGGKTTWYRTTNDFKGTDRIHFESAQSADGKTWTTTRSGDEVHALSATR